MEKPDQITLSGLAQGSFFMDSPILHLHHMNMAIRFMIVDTQYPLTMRKLAFSAFLGS